MTNDISVTHDTSAQRFLCEVDGNTAVLDYRLEPNVMRITHTGVPNAIGGRGIAGQLMQAALAYAQTQQWKVQPDCSYAAVFFDKHPAYAALRK